MTKPLVSVIIPVFNAERYLGETLQSVLSQDYEPKEIIVVDDGSRDGSAAIPARHPGVTCFRQENKGDAAARNQGIRLARGNYLAFIDADDLWLPHKLSLQMETHLKGPELGYSLTHEICFLESGVARPSWLREELLRSAHVGVLSTMVAHRSVFERVGLFNENLPVGSDMEWLTRSKDMGVPNTVVSTLLLRRRIHQTNMSHRYVEANNAVLLRMMRDSVLRRRQGKNGGNHE